MKSFEKKLRKKVQKMSDKRLNGCLSVLGILALFARFDIETLKKIELGCISDVANTVDSFAAPFLDIFENNLIKFLIYALFGIALLLRIYKLFIRPKAIVISHSSFSNTQSTYDPGIVSGYSVKEKEINVVDQMAHNNIVDAIRTQDALIEDVVRDCDSNTELIYYGIAHTPLIFRAGFQIGDEGSIRLLHKYRNDQSFFREISSEPDTNAVRMKCVTVENAKDSNEMLVIISTSLQIKPNDLLCLQCRNVCCELHFEMEEKAMYGFDSVVSYPTMARLKADILRDIRDKVISKGIKRIHLALSASSDFTFCLAQGFSKNHDPEIIVYHYDCNANIKYPWGVSNISTPANAVVRHTNHQPVD